MGKMAEARRSDAREPSDPVDHPDDLPEPTGTHIDRDRYALGVAFLKRLDDVADLQIALIGDGPWARPTSIAASQSFGSWLITGKADLPIIGEFTREGASGLIQDLTSLRMITKLALSWRDAVVFVLREEAELLALPEEVLKAALVAVQDSSDSFAVQ